MAMPFARLLLRARARLRGAARARADAVNAYSIWPENWARPMFEEFEKATGIKVNFVRFSLGRGARARHRREEQSARRRAVRRAGGDVRRRHQRRRVRAVQAALLRHAAARASSTPTASGSPSPTIRSCS